MALLPLRLREEDAAFDLAMGKPSEVVLFACFAVSIGVRSAVLFCYLAETFRKGKHAGDVPPQILWRKLRGRSADVLMQQAAVSFEKREQGFRGGCRNDWLVVGHWDAYSVLENSPWYLAAASQ
jgi:hypothetical protein